MQKVALCLFIIGFCSCNKLSGDGTCTSDEEYASVYAKILGTDFSDEGGKFAQAILGHLANPAKVNMLEVGSGPCNLAAPLSKQLNNVVLVEPNLEFHGQCRAFFEKVAPSQKYELVAAKFQDFTCTDKYDLVVISHVLYFVDKTERQQFIDKAAKECLAPNGVIAIAISSDTGGHHDVVQHYNPEAANIGDVRKWCSSNSAHFSCSNTKDRVDIRYDQPDISKNFEDMFRLSYFLIVEDAFDQQKYRTLTAEKHHKLEAELREYTWSLREGDSPAFATHLLGEWVWIQHKTNDEL